MRRIGVLVTQDVTRPQLINMTPTRAATELGVDPNNLTNQLATILRESFGIEPKGRGHVYHNDHVADYIRRFRDTKNGCFNLNISEKDLADLAYSGLTPHIKEKLESRLFRC
jgi:hypothetical protein